MTKYRTLITVTAAALFAATLPLPLPLPLHHLAHFELVPQAHADEARLNPFFEKLEGHWSGQGTLQTLNANGTVTTTTYTAEIQTDREQDGIWDASNHVVDQFGQSAENTLTYSVQGEQ